MPLNLKTGRLLPATPETPRLANYRGSGLVLRPKAAVPDTSDHDDLGRDDVERGFVAGPGRPQLRRHRQRRDQMEPRVRILGADVASPYHSPQEATSAGGAN